MLSDKGQTQIFISYPHNSKEVARYLGKFLKDVGFETHYIKEATGGKWENVSKMRISISNSDFFLFCMVKKSFFNFVLDLLVKHPFKRMKLFDREIRHALRIYYAKPPEDNFLIICQLEKCRVSNRFIDIPSVELFESEGYEKLVELIKSGMEHQGGTYKPYIRSEPKSDLSIHEATRMIRIKEFFNREWNNEVEGFNNKCDFDVHQGEKIFIERTAGRMWQRYTSNKFMEDKDAQQHVEYLNEIQFAGYTDWRLPTLDEALTLMRRQIDKDFFIHPHIYDRSNWILTSDQDDGAFWIVNHNLGFCRIGQAVDGICVRAVRFAKKAG